MVHFVSCWLLIGQLEEAGSVVYVGVKLWKQ